jgi:hypothetical protein
MELEGSLPHLQCPPPVSILSQPNPVHTPSSQFLKIRLNIIVPSTPGSPHWSLFHQVSVLKITVMRWIVFIYKQAYCTEGAVVENMVLKWATVSYALLLQVNIPKYCMLVVDTVRRCNTFLRETDEALTLIITDKTF